MCTGVCAPVYTTLSEGYRVLNRVWFRDLSVSLIHGSSEDSTVKLSAYSSVYSSKCFQV